MDAPLPIGTKVKQVVPVIEGKITDLAFDKGTLKFNYLVDYKDSDGAVHQRWFSAAEVQQVGA